MLMVESVYIAVPYDVMAYSSVDIYERSWGACPNCMSSIFT